MMGSSPTTKVSSDEDLHQRQVDAEQRQHHVEVQPT